MDAGHYQPTAKMEAFDSFWEAPENVEKGYLTFGTFYRHNYLKHFSADKNANILVISCGPGYMVKLLNEEGYKNVLGIDSIEEKIEPARKHNLNCQHDQAFHHLKDRKAVYDIIFCEQEINHLTKEEIILFLELCHANLKDSGRLIFHSLNGANPFVGSENLALNFDHYNTFTEKSLEQVLAFSKFGNIEIFPLNLYVFFRNPFNYLGILFNLLINQFLKLCFKFYGKTNNIFSKKIGAVGQK